MEVVKCNKKEIVNINGNLYIDDRPKKNKLKNFKKTLLRKIVYKEWVVDLNSWESKTQYFGFINIYKLSLYNKSIKYSLIKNKGRRIRKPILCYLSTTKNQAKSKFGSLWSTPINYTIK